MAKTIWDIRIIRVVCFDGEVHVEKVSVRDLMEENDHTPLVRAILETVADGQVYDDSGRTCGAYVWYLPAEGVFIDEKQLL